MKYTLILYCGIATLIKVAWGFQQSSMHTIQYIPHSSTNSVYSNQLHKHQSKKSKLFAGSEIIMPALSSTMTEGRIVKWNKNVGDAVKAGESIMVVESDKADMEVEAFDSGFLAAQYVAENESCSVGKVVGIIVRDKSEINSISNKPVEEKSESLKTVKLNMPHVGNRTSALHIVSWNVKEGQSVRANQVLFVVENDKCDFEVEAPYDGTLSKILLGAGVKVSPGHPVADFIPSGENAAASGSVTEAPVVKNTEKVENVQTLPPNTTQVLMPALSSTMKSGRITKWLKSPGDTIKAGDHIVVVESDKADMEVEAFESGILAAQVIKEAEEADVGSVIAYICKSASDIPLIERAMSSQPEKGQSAAVPIELEKASTSGSSPPTDNKTNLEGIREWTHPAVDQHFAREILPQGVSQQDVRSIFINRVNKTYPKAKEILENDGEYIDRLQFRVPPPHILLNEGKNVFQNISGKGSPSGHASSAPKMATPGAESMIKKHNINIQDIEGSGYNGRVIVQDVHKHLNMENPEGHVSSHFDRSMENTKTENKSATTQPKENAKSKNTITVKSSDIPNAGILKMTSMQKAISKNMEATLGVPIFRVTRSACVDKFEDILKQVRIAQNPAVTLSILMAKAVAYMLARHPIINSAYDAKDGGSIKNFGTVDIGMAVATPTGLVTPVLRDAHTKDIHTLTTEFKALVDKARNGTLSGKDTSQATFYISNLGMFGVDQFDAILPPNVGCILAVSAAKDVYTQNGIKKMLNMTITCDHRHIYGAHAAEFMKDLSELIENYPSAVLT